jgi:hypothetical protein
MPVSRSRKPKKSNKKPQSKNKEIFRDGPMEIIRQGRHIFMRNRMTEAQHQQYIEQVKEGRPKAYEEIKVMIADVKAMIDNYDRLFVLSGLSAMCLLKMQTDREDDGLSEVTLEYAQSLILADKENPNKGKLPDHNALISILEKLKEIRHQFKWYFISESIAERYPPIEAAVRRDMIVETLYVRGEGYLQHMYELFRELFGPHDHKLQEKYEFESQDIPAAFEHFELGLAMRMMMPNGLPHPLQTRVFRQWMGKNKPSRDSIMSGVYLNDFAKDHPEIIVENNNVVLYKLNYINLTDRLFKINFLGSEREQKIAKTLSISLGDNEEFKKPEKFKYEVLNKTKIYYQPIVENDGDYYLFNVNSWARNLFRITQNLLKQADLEYFESKFLGSSFYDSRDNFIERKGLSLFERMLTGVKFYANGKYHYNENEIDLKCAKAADGNYELDILGISDKATYLIEVKAGEIGEDAKRGALSSIKSDLTNIIGDAICQSYRASRYIENTADCVFTLPDKSNVKPVNCENLIRISVSFSYAGTIISSLSLLQEFGVVDKNAVFGWTVNIYDLFVFSDLIESEEQFLDYLSKRLPLYKDERLASVDEVNMLGFYFSEDLKIAAKHRDAGLLQFSGYAKSIDAYYQTGGPKPFKKRNKKSNNK